MASSRCLILLAPTIGTVTTGLPTVLPQINAVRGDVARPELLALITSTYIPADRQQWKPGLRDRVLAVIFDGLRRPLICHAPTCWPARQLPQQRTAGHDDSVNSRVQETANASV
jgi:Transcriptional regulator SbtR-like, C-terminal domain